MKILLTGAGGLLGWDCCVVFQQHHEVIALDIQKLDITRADQVDEALGRVRPDAVVNCAAFTQVDRCETARDEAFQVNVLGPRNLAAAASRQGAVLLQVSTDYVFDGQKPPPTPYFEDDPTGPLSWYGRTKLEGELAVREVSDRHLIVRTAWLYGWHGPNFLKKILELALSPQIPELKVVADQFGSPTWSYRLAQQLARLLESGGEGIYHASGEGWCTWFDLAQAFLGHFGVEKPLRPCSTTEYLTPAVRPRNSILENRRLKAAGLNLMRPWQEDLEEFVTLFRKDLLAEAREGRQ
ncbi:MAG: dTDP-4-dehydrorhamnose reductase [Desulfobaccales bacterium]